MTNKFFGRYNVKIDSGKRIMLPAQLREKINESSLFITQSPDNYCLWLFTPEKWEELIFQKIEENTNLFSGEDRSLRRQLIGDAYDVKMDESGRILIEKILCDLAGINKNCWVIGQLDYIEIWDAERYLQYQESGKTKEDIAAASMNISNRIKRDKGLD